MKKQWHEYLETILATSGRNSSYLKFPDSKTAAIWEVVRRVGDVGEQAAVPCPAPTAALSSPNLERSMTDSRRSFWLYNFWLNSAVHLAIQESKYFIHLLMPRTMPSYGDLIVKNNKYDPFYHGIFSLSWKNWF